MSADMIHRVGNFELELTDAGLVIFTAPQTPPGQVTVPPPGRQRFELPLLVFTAFAAAYVRHEEAKKVDQMTTDELLRMKFSRADVIKASIRVREAFESLHHMRKITTNLHPVLDETLRKSTAELERMFYGLDELAMKAG